MNIILIKDFFLSYSIVTIVIAGIVSILSILADKFLEEKIPLYIRKYAPFLIAILLSIAYDMIFNIKAFEVNENAFASGLISGSISYVIKSIINKIISGKGVNFDPIVMIIEQLLIGYVSSDSITKTAIVISEIVKREIDDEEVKEQILTALKDNSNSEYLRDELLPLVDLIKSSIENLDEE